MELTPNWQTHLAPTASLADRVAILRILRRAEAEPASELDFWSGGDIHRVMRFLGASPGLNFVIWWGESSPWRRFVRCSSNLDAVRGLLTSVLGGLPVAPSTTAHSPNTALGGYRTADCFDLVDRFLVDVLRRTDIRPLIVWQVDGEPNIYVDTNTWSVADANKHLSLLLRDVLGSPVPPVNERGLGLLMAARAEEHLSLPNPPGLLRYRPDWRQRRLTWLRKNGRRPRRGVDDEAIRAAHGLLTTSDGQHVVPEASALLAATKISMGPVLRKAVLEAWLLTGQPDREIAKANSEYIRTVSWYEKMYFEVRDRLEQRDLLLKTAIGSVRPIDPAEQQVAAFVKRYAYLGGVEVLRAAINCLPRLMAVASGGPPQVLQDDQPATTYMQLLFAQERLPPNPIVEMRLAAVMDRMHRPTADRPDLVGEWVAEQLSGTTTVVRAPDRTRQLRATAG